MEPKYTTKQAVERKVGAVPGWEELLMATGFHFIHPIKKDVATTIVYPEHDDSGIQRKCQEQLEALLSIPHCLRPISSLSKHPTSSLPILASVSATLCVYFSTLSQSLSLPPSLPPSLSLLPASLCQSQCRDS